MKPGDSAASLLIKRITGEIAPRMPLGGDPLSEKELALLRTWIDEGARATPTSAAGKARWATHDGEAVKKKRNGSAAEVPSLSWATLLGLPNG